MEYKCFCIVNTILYLCTSEIDHLLSYLQSKGLDVSKSDQGNILHNSEEYVIECSDHLHFIEPILFNILKNPLYFEGENTPVHNSKIKQVKYVWISESIHMAPTLLEEMVEVEEEIFNDKLYSEEVDIIKKIN